MRCLSALRVPLTRRVYSDLAKQCDIIGYDGSQKHQTHVDKY